MASRRLSFRLSEGSREAETWQKLKERSPDHKDQHIFNELLRRERIRLDNKETHSDALIRLEGIAKETREEVLEMKDMLRKGRLNE